MDAPRRFLIALGATALAVPIAYIMTGSAARFRPPGRPSPRTDATPAPVVDPERTDVTPATVVDLFGWLKATDGLLVSENTAEPVRLRGMSMFWSQWMGDYWNAGVIDRLVDDWHVTVVRAAMAAEPDTGGYHEEPGPNLERLQEVVQACVRRGIYVIIDWHAHEKLEAEAAAFFGQMAEEYGQLPNVIFEIWNEPKSEYDWAEIKAYHEGIVDEIRSRGGERSLVICGTPAYSLDVGSAEAEPVERENVAYTLHIYAASHKGERSRVESVLDAKKITIFVTEWGVGETEGVDVADFGEGQSWLDLWYNHRVSDANWYVGAKEIGDVPDKCQALNASADKQGADWGDDSLTASGLFVRDSIRRYFATEIRPLLSEGAGPAAVEVRA